MDITLLEMYIRDYGEVMALWKSTEGIGLSGADSLDRIWGKIGWSQRMELFIFSRDTVLPAQETPS